MEFRVLGPIEVHSDGVALPLAGSRQRAVLGMLALHANRVLATERLLRSVWGPTPPRTARTSLQGQVSKLRRLLAGVGERDRLVHRPPGYVLWIAPEELDLEQFRRLADEGRRRLALGDAEQASLSLHAALGLWRGRALEDADLPGLREEVDGLQDRRLAVLEDRIEADLRRGRDGDLVAELQDLVRLHPTRERLWAELMVALHAAGRQTDALAAYRRLREHLVEQLGVEPSATLQQLERAVLSGADALETYLGKLGAPPARATTTTAQQPDDSVSPGVPAQLPAAVSSFVGRTEHLELLDGLLAGEGGAPGAVVISALAGMAGVGKTALAIHCQ